MKKMPIKKMKHNLDAMSNAENDVRESISKDTGVPKDEIEFITPPECVKEGCGFEDKEVSTFYFCGSDLEIDIVVGYVNEGGTPIDRIDGRTYIKVDGVTIDNLSDRIRNRTFDEAKAMLSNSMKYVKEEINKFR